MKRRALICGDRNWKNFHFIYRTLSALNDAYGVEVVIEGEANGADKMGRAAAEQMNIPVLPFRAEWEKHGKAAGPIRNQQQLDEGKPDMCLAFHNDIANSKGTKDMVRRCMKAGIETHVFTEKGEVKCRLRGNQ